MGRVVIPEGAIWALAVCTSLLLYGKGQGVQESQTAPEVPRGP